MDAGHSDERKQFPVLTAEEVLARVRQNLHEGTKKYRAMFSSAVGGMTKDPAAMSVALDDHIVHRGHAVFDTAFFWDGYLYEVVPHVERLLRSAAAAKIKSPFTKDELCDIISQLAGVSGLQSGSVRYWLSAGPGSFDLSPAGCVGPTFYGVAIDDFADGEFVTESALSVITSSIPMKPPAFAKLKSTNYLPNALVMAEAIERGAHTGVWVDSLGFIAEGPNMNVAFVTEEGELLVPEFGNILEGCTSKRMLQLAPQLLTAQPGGSQPLLSKISVGQISVARARAAKEMLAVGSGTLIVPVVTWDGVVVGDGNPGPVTLALKALMLNDKDTAEAPQRIKIQYR